MIQEFDENESDSSISDGSEHESEENKSIIDQHVQDAMN